jgi:hypothetical protein
MNTLQPFLLPLLQPTNQPLLHPNPLITISLMPSTNNQSNSMTQYGVIFITTKTLTYHNGEIYDYKDAFLVNENDSNDMTLRWKGQKKHRRDYIVTNGDREVHVFSRKKQNESYIYRGIIMNDTIIQSEIGNADEGIPSIYYFRLRTNNLIIPYGSICGRTQKLSVNILGFKINGNSNGIYTMTKNNNELITMN